MPALDRVPLLLDRCLRRGLCRGPLEGKLHDVVDPFVRQRRILRRRRARRGARRFRRRLAIRRRPIEQHIGVRRAECPFGRAPRAALLDAVVEQDAEHDQRPDRKQADLKIAQAASSSRIRSASSMSTATTRDTPDSGIVTPIS